MKNNRIALKLFLITSVVFILFITATIIFQNLFFEKYYVRKKYNNFTNSLKSLSDSLSKSKLDKDTASSKFRKFDDENNSKSIIINVEQYYYHLANGTIVSDLGGYAFFTLDKKANETTILQLIKEWFYASRSQTEHDDVINNKKILIKTRNINNTDYIIGIAPIIKNNTVGNIVISMASLQPVGDAVNTMKEFYIYIYVIAVLLILILSFLYSIMISKPLVKLKNAAFKMTELDFSTKCDVSSRDEIGELGGILNFLSEKLDKTLGELKTSNDKLKEDIEKERQLEIMRKEFVTAVSHELKTPITLIGGYAEALKDNIGTPEDNDFFVDIIMDEANKMDFLIKDMLDLSQLESGAYKMNFEKFNIVDLTEFVIKKFSRKIKERQIRFEINKDNSCVIVSGDIHRIEQVLVNLISNAIRHVEEAGIIKIEIKNYDNRYVISVENQGKHIDPEEQEKIWQRFYKIDKSRNREDEGTGIGLSIVKNILTQHNSNFGVENTELGVKFYFTLE